MVSEFLMEVISSAPSMAKREGGLSKTEDLCKGFDGDGVLFPSLPEAIIIEILARLPVKTLLKFRSVSTTWRRLISTNYFVKIHLENSIKDAKLSRHSILFTECLPIFELKRCSVESLMSETWGFESEFDYPGKSFCRDLSVVGSIDGLVCIGDEEHVFLWNPSTRIYRRLPNFSVQLPTGFYVIWGFGYDEHDDDYKVVGIFCWMGIGSFYETVVLIYSLKCDSWRRINDFKNGIPLDNVGKFSNGKIHYPTTGLGFENNWEIMSLDLNTEKYEIIEKPSCWNDDSDYSLGLLEGSICVIRNFVRSHVDVWVMKEYCVKDSWIKLFSVSHSGNPQYPVPLIVLRNGEVLLFFGMYFVGFDSGSRTLRYSRPNRRTAFLEADVYVESLVSPFVNA